MYYRHDLNYQYPDKCDQHMITVKHLRDVVLDENYPYLQKGFGFWGYVSVRQRLMFAGMLLQESKEQNEVSETALIQSSIATVVAQQAAMISVMAASSAAASSYSEDSKFIRAVISAATASSNSPAIRALTATSGSVC